eukprot:TRINITY_DN18790_c0_g1_i1.p1 TRINITY_DN18790_c0_g1~~TRINITY_DN18790_c0_g1_i1.p1  ORF type:complete len:349 (-),score=34.71 TRINITY_DN18790_c0_g1_i1:171-1217(-)
MCIRDSHPTDQEPQLHQEPTATQQHPDYIDVPRHPSAPPPPFNAHPKVPPDITLSQSIVRRGAQIGQRSSGKVYLGAVVSGSFPDRANQTHMILIALKKIRLETQASKNQFKQEVATMQNLRHENILSLLDYSALLQGTATAYIALEYAPAGSSAKYLPLIRDCGPRLIAHLLRQVACGMEYLHERDVIHRDLAARNILFQVEGFDGSMTEEMLWRCTCKIADFGMARKYRRERNTTKSRECPPSSPPEFVLGKYEKGSDVWSFGFFGIELLSGKVSAFPSDVHIPAAKVQFWSRVYTGAHPDKPANCPDRLWTILLKCWSRAPNDRPTFRQLQDTLCQFSAAMYKND